MTDPVPAPVTDPVPPPTESGWYVVECIQEEPQYAKEIIYVDVDFFAPVVVVSPINFEGWRNWEEIEVVRYTGPLDLEKLLDEGGER